MVYKSKRGLLTIHYSSLLSGLRDKSKFANQCSVSLSERVSNLSLSISTKKYTCSSYCPFSQPVYKDIHYRKRVGLSNKMKYFSQLVSSEEEIAFILYGSPE